MTEQTEKVIKDIFSLAKKNNKPTFNNLSINKMSKKLDIQNRPKQENIFDEEKTDRESNRESKKEDSKESQEEFLKFINNLKDLDIKALSYLDPSYPSELMTLSDAPSIVFYQGNLDLLKHKTMGIVGSREMDGYSQKIISHALNGSSKTIVSGLAVGIDAAAHKTALLEANLPCIAVIAGGLDKATFYPKENWNLKQEIIERKGLIISEYPPFEKPKRAYFINRNRLISALSDELLVVKASMRSGSLSTARRSLKLGKQVTTAPFALFNQEYAGNIWLLNNGAKSLALKEQEGEQEGELEKERQKDQAKPLELTKDQEKLVKILKEPLELDEICQQTGLEYEEVLAIIFELEMIGIIKNEGNLYKTETQI